MATNDFELLHAWVRRRDGEAFTELYTRYAGLVYSACVRILRNASDAEEVAQECFLEFSRSANTIKDSVPAWLHKLATRRAIDKIRSEGRRRQREDLAAQGQSEAVPPSWSDLEEHIDQAIAALPEELAGIIVGRFIHGNTEAVLAEELGMTRSQIRYRLDKAIGQIRQSLRRKGLAATAPILLGLCEANLAQAAVVPATLNKAAAVIALAGLSEGAGVGALAGVTFALSAKYVAAAVVALLVGGGALWSATQEKKAASATVVAQADAPQATPIAEALPEDNAPEAGELLLDFFMLAADEHFGKALPVPEHLEPAMEALKGKHGLTDIYLLRADRLPCPSGHGLQLAYILGDEAERREVFFTYPSTATDEEKRVAYVAAKAASPESDVNIGITAEDGSLLGPRTYLVRLGNATRGGETGRIHIENLVAGMETPILSRSGGDTRVDRVALGLKTDNLDLEDGKVALLGQCAYGASGEPAPVIAQYIAAHPIFIAVRATRQ